jgi:hypothetical protein
MKSSAQNGVLWIRNPLGVVLALGVFGALAHDRLTRNDRIKAFHASAQSPTHPTTSEPANPPASANPFSRIARETAGDEAKSAAKVDALVAEWAAKPWEEKTTFWLRGILDADKDSICESLCRYGRAKRVEIHSVVKSPRGFTCQYTLHWDSPAFDDRSAKIEESYDSKSKYFYDSKILHTTGVIDEEASYKQGKGISHHGKRGQFFGTTPEYHD